MNRPVPKVAIIGSGNVGSNAALFLALCRPAELALIDIVEGLAEGRALDISQGLTILGRETAVSGSSDFRLLQGADIVVVTA